MKRGLKRNIKLARIIIYKETLIDKREHLWTFAGSFCGIGLIGWLNSYLFDVYDNIFLIGSFGASSVLIYGIINSPLAQPRNLIGGHLICAFTGVTIHYLIPETACETLSFRIDCPVALNITSIPATSTTDLNMKWSLPIKGA